MKKKLWITIIAVLVFAILFVPIPTGVYKDGGTREYTALTYKIVDWNRMTGDSTYAKTKIYPLPYNFKSIDSLWYYEEDNIENVDIKFRATVLEIEDDVVFVEPVENTDERLSSDKIGLNTKDLEDIGVAVGSVVEITYDGVILELYPASINAISWELVNDLRHLEYKEQWLDKNTAKKCANDTFSDIIITQIYSNCFFAKTVLPFSNEIKLNGILSDEWCVGDQIIGTYSNVYKDEENNRFEADFKNIKESDWQAEPEMAYKPVIYLYPQHETEVFVNLTLDGKLSCTYPEYKDGWSVIALPDGTLTDATGLTYNYLYWEGETYAQYDLSKGFCIKGGDTAKFLESALEKLGLNRREANEFIVYWLPLMEQNEYNIISFQTDIYTDAAMLDVNPIPDTLIRVFMVWQATDEYVDIVKQELTAPARTGFTVVEWGGTEIK